MNGKWNTNFLSCLDTSQVVSNLYANVKDTYRLSGASMGEGGD